MDYLRPAFSALYALFQPVVSPASDPERITQVFCGVILACFATCLVFGLWKRKSNALRFSQSATTVLGILGTFIGIALGLKDFDTNNIEQSVPPLLAGLKTAFLTSIVGIGATLATRILSVFSGEDPKTILQVLREIATASQNLGNLLREQGEAEKENHRQTLESLESIRASVSGEGDTSMLTQIQKLRTTFTDKQDELIQEFQNFVEKMAEANSQKLIEALEEVMRDFNAKINDQLGDNFKQLNEGVGKLVDWQDKYAQQTETMIEQFERTVSTIEQVRDSIERISKCSEAITKAAETIDPVLATIQEQGKQMGEHLTKISDIMEVFVGMSEKAEEIVPTFDEKMSELTENFTKLEETARQNISLVRVHVEDAERQQKALVSELAGRLHSQITETFENTEQQIAQLTQRSSRSTDARMQEIDEKLGEQLTKVMEEFGRRLASISDRFADDYGPLADELRRVMEMVRELRRGLR